MLVQNISSSQLTNYLNNVNYNSSSIIHADDIIFDGVPLSETLKNIQKRLLILQPNKELLEKHEMLRKAYDEYLILEQLLTASS